MTDFLHIFDPREHPSMAVFVSQVVMRLVLAAFLGGAIGLERELKNKAAGLRTNMFICFGAAMFTVLSDRLAVGFGGDHTRIAAQIIPGIGFIGAGSILHARGSVQGLTSAATMFVVASIGMAAGGGLYLPALFATILLLFSLHVLGLLEVRFHLRPLTMSYELLGHSTERILASVDEVIDKARMVMRSVQVGRVDEMSRVIFKAIGTRTQHEQVMKELRNFAAIEKIVSATTIEEE